MKILFTTALIIAAVTSLVHAQEELRLSPSDINALTSVNAGAGTSGVSGIQTRTLKGDATKSGIYTIQLTIPANVRIQAHTHPDDRVATVISGTWYIGYGAKFDDAKLKPLTAGSFYTEPPSVAHFAKTGNEPVVLQITGNGPTGTGQKGTRTQSQPTCRRQDRLIHLRITSARFRKMARRRNQRARSGRLTGRKPKGQPAGLATAIACVSSRFDRYEATCKLSSGGH